MKKTQISLVAIITASLFLCKNASAVLPVPVYSGIFNFSSGQLGTVGSSEGWANNNTNITVARLVAAAWTALVLDWWLLQETRLIFPLQPRPGWAVIIYLQINMAMRKPIRRIYIFPFFINLTALMALEILWKFVRRIFRTAAARFIGIFQARTNNSGQIQLGIEKAPGSGTVVFATNNINVGDTVFVVVRHQILTGSGNDIMDLWIDPPPASFGVDEASLPPTSATTSTGTESSSTTGPGRFYLDVGVGSAEFDELRIATNWAVVTPAYGSCVSAGIYQSPVSQTNVAEIADTFTVIPSPTST